MKKGCGSCKEFTMHIRLPRLVLLAIKRMQLHHHTPQGSASIISISLHNRSPCSLMHKVAVQLNRKWLEMVTEYLILKKNSFGSNPRLKVYSRGVKLICPFELNLDHGTSHRPDTECGASHGLDNLCGAALINAFARAAVSAWLWNPGS